MTREIDQFIRPIRFSVCTLVTNTEEYKSMLASFGRAGFIGELCEFIYVDNSKGNKYDAYAGLNKMMTAATGKYIILCHQDVELNYDRLDVLEERIKEMDALDPNWAILSNAGGLHLKKRVERMHYPHKEMNIGPFPFQVKSVDENFILIKQEANLGFSHNMKGYHLYGTDLCIIAHALGYTAWVIDFALLHKSTGNTNDSFYQNKKELISKYQRAFHPRYIRSTCTILYISGNRFYNRILNSGIMIFAGKALRKLRSKLDSSYHY